MRVPEGWSCTEAASVPTVFLTADYALVDLCEWSVASRCCCMVWPWAWGWRLLQIADIWVLRRSLRPPRSGRPSKGSVSTVSGSVLRVMWSSRRGS